MRGKSEPAFTLFGTWPGPVLNSSAVTCVRIWHQRNERDNSLKTLNSQNVTLGHLSPYQFVMVVINYLLKNIGDIEAHIDI